MHDGGVSDTFPSRMATRIFVEQPPVPPANVVDQHDVAAARMAFDPLAVVDVVEMMPAIRKTEVDLTGFADDRQGGNL